MSAVLLRPAVDGTLNFKFYSYDSNGEPVAPSSAFVAADLRVYKESSATQRSSTAGVTVTSPFDSMVGCHHVSLDLSDDTDSGFYTEGSYYEVVLNPSTTTVDSKTVLTTVARFVIGRTASEVTLEGKVDTVDTAVDGISASALADAILDETIPEPASPFTWPGTLRTIMGWIGAKSRNKGIQTSTTTTLRNDADDANIGTSTITHSDGTFIRGEWS